MNKSKNINSIIIIFTFLFAFYGKQLFAGLFQITNQSYLFNLIYSYLWWTIPTVIVVISLYGKNNLLKEIGISKDIIKGFLFALVTVSPMLISSAIAGNISKDLNILSLLQSTLFAGFFEEFLFRGFLFGLLFRKCGWGFIPASLLGALIFGLGHIYQGNSFGETLGVFFITGIGAVWFAWLYIEWDENLWIPIFLHILMNTAWILFEVSSNALGGFYTNLFRIITIALTVILTIRNNKKKGYSIRKTNLIINNN